MVQREKKTHPEPCCPVIGGSSPKCGPQRKTRGNSPAPQKPGRLPQRRGHSSHPFMLHIIPFLRSPVSLISIPLAFARRFWYTTRQYQTPKRKKETW